MPTARPGFLASTPARTFGFGSSDTGSTQAIFTSAPLYTDLTDQKIRDSFDLPPELQNGQINDGGYAWGLVDREYQGTPNFDDVPTGAGGLPASPFGPNIGTPSVSDSANPTTISADPEKTLGMVSPSRGAFIGNGLVSPSKTTAGIAPRRLGQNLPLGVGSGNTFINRT